MASDVIVPTMGVGTYKDYCLVLSPAVCSMKVCRDVPGLVEEEEQKQPSSALCVSTLCCAAAASSLYTK